MSTVVRAADAPVSTRMDYWQHHVDRSLSIPLRGRPDLGHRFDGRMHVGELGPVQVAEAIVPPGECFRTPQMIRQADPALYCVDVVTEGRVVVEQNDHEADLGPGDFTFVDSSRPARYRHTAVRHVTVTFPHALLPLAPDDAARLAGLRFAGDEGTGALVSSFVRRLPDHLGGCGAAEGVRLGTAVVDLMAAVLAARLDGDAGVPYDSRRRVLLARVHAFIEQRLTDPRLSPATIAAAHHISVRYLHKLFESERTTVAEWIRRRRLERCRRDLLDPALRSRPVSAIAARWGFTDPAHFSRLFRSAYDVPPGAYRTSAGTGPH